MKMKLHKKIDSQEDRLTVILSGDLTGKGALELKRDLFHLLEECPLECYIDIRDLNRIDITGVNTLTMAHRKANAIGERLVLLSKPNHPAHEFMHLTKLHDYFNVELIQS